MEFKSFKSQFCNTIEITDSVDVNENTNFSKIEDWDSLSHMAISAMIDAEYGVMISSDELEELKTLGNLFNFLKNKTDER